MNPAGIGVLAIGVVVIGAVILYATASKGHSNETEQADMSQVLSQLDEAHFFKHVPPEKKNDLMAEIQKSGFLYADGLARYRHADAERVAETGVLEFIAEIAPMLSLRGIHIPLRQERRANRRMRDSKTGNIVEVERHVRVVDDTIPDPPGQKYLRPAREECPESGAYYRVTLGNHTREIWNSETPESRFWDTAMHHTLLLINATLADTRSDERVYGVAEGNDAHIVFLTKEQLDIIRNSPAIKSELKPWVPHEAEAQSRPRNTR